MIRLQRPELSNFVRVTLRHPWLWPGYAGGLLRLALRRAGNMARTRTARASHLGLKRWPEWLPAGAGSAIVDGGWGFAFPPYAVRRQAPVDRPCFDAADPEGYLYEQRWPACLEALLAGETQALAALKAALEWISNPPDRTDAAWEPYSASERVANLAVLLAAFPDCLRQVRDRHALTVARFFADSASWITSRLEYYGMARTNNHLLNNARALAIAGGVLGDAAMTTLGLKLFDHMAGLLFGADGFLRERSSHYQYVAANWLNDLVHFAPLARAEDDGTLERLRELLARVNSASSRLAAGLSDAGCHIGDLSPDCSPAASLARLRALYPEALSIAGPPGSWQMDDWLCINAGSQRLLACGVPAQLPIDFATHGHADLGGFIWSSDGAAVLVDAGRANYAATIESRQQVSAAGHNTLTVNGLAPLAESLLATGRWCPLPYASARARMLARGDAGFDIEHDGFGRIPGVGTHRREIRLHDGSLAVRDWLEGAGRARIACSWLLAPGFRPVEGAPATAEGRGRRLEMRLPSGAHPRWEQYPYSATYGVVERAFSLRFALDAPLPWSGLTEMRLLPCAG